MTQVDHICKGDNHTACTAALIRASGVKAGLGTHVPEVILRAEREGWDVDFYMACLYNERRTQRGQQSGFITGNPKDLVFYPGDPPFMCDAIKSTEKPCIAFKLFKENAGIASRVLNGRVL